MRRAKPFGAFLAAWVLFAAPIPAQDLGIQVEVEGIPSGGVIYGAAGAVLRVPVAVHLDLAAEGVTGWIFTVAITGGGSPQVGFDRCNSECKALRIFGDASRWNELLAARPYILDPAHEPTEGPLAGQGPQGPGFHDFDLISSPEPGSGIRPLPPGRYLVSRFYLDFTLPREGPGEAVRLWFLDGMQLTTGSGFPLPGAAIFVGPTEVKAAVNEFHFRVAPANYALPGDLDQSGRLDLIDAIAVLTRHAFGEGPLPCDTDAGNLAMADVDGNGRLGVNDGIRLLSRIFLGTAPHVLGDGCSLVPGCPSLCDP